jgi:hypothetical protein
MPRRSILSAAERESLLALPDTKDDLIRTTRSAKPTCPSSGSGAGLPIGWASPCSFATCAFPASSWASMSRRFRPCCASWRRSSRPVESWDDYGQREQTRREHLVELQTVFGFQPFTMSHYRQAVHTLTELAMQTDKGIVLASALIEHLRRQSIILPALNAIERASAEAITRANRRIYEALSEPLSSAHRIAWTNC